MNQTNSESSTPVTECARFEERLLAYLEQSLDESARDWMERHEASCVTCHTLLRDLDRIVESARDLPTFSPSRDLWPEIVSRLDAPVLPLHTTSANTDTGASDVLPDNAPSMVTAVAHAAPAARRHLSMRTFAIAATMLVALSSTITWQIARSRTGTATAVASRDSMRGDVTLKPVVSAGVTYEQEIAALRSIVNERFAELDSATVSELQRNLAIIDKAIADSRQALAQDPSSRMLSTSLDRALEVKLSLMRRVALL